MIFITLAEAKRKEQFKIEKTVSLPTITKEKQVNKKKEQNVNTSETLNDGMVDDYDFGGFDLVMNDVYDSHQASSSGQNNNSNHQTPSVVDVVDHNVNNSTSNNQKPNVTIKKKTKTNNSEKTNTSSSPISSPISPKSVTFSSSSSDSNQHLRM